MDEWTEAFKEALVSAPEGVVIINTLELSHPSLATPLFIVQDYYPHYFLLEDGVTMKEFLPAPFRIVPPAANSDGAKEMSISIDNVDKSVSDFLAMLGRNPDPVEVTFRAYLEDQTTPQNIDPLTLFLSDISVNEFEVSGRASFADIINRPFLSELYTTTKFPGLKG